MRKSKHLAYSLYQAAFSLYNNPSYIGNIFLHLRMQVGVSPLITSVKYFKTIP